MGVLILDSPGAARAAADDWRRQGRSIGLVPTMGALHAGHRSLVRRARADNDSIAVSIFVNPLQFGPGEDFERYPRALDRDLEILAEEGIDAAYTPALADIYPKGAASRVHVGGLGDVLEAVQRPGHFEGVATVVLKLLNTVRPDRAYFGQKDAQQAALVTRLAVDLDTGAEIVVCPTVREADGLALSSRNLYLTPREREAATCLVRALRVANRAYMGGTRDLQRLQGALLSVLRDEPLATVDYVEMVDPESFGGPGRLAVLAVRIGFTRLIDNHLLGEPLPE